MDTQSSSPEFDNFWEASSFSQYNIAEFGRTVETYSGTDKPELSLAFPGPNHILKLPSSKLNKITSNRKSERDFSDRALTDKQIGHLFASFRAMDGLEHRAYASAGAAYPLEIFMLALNVTGNLHQKILYYNADNHSVTAVGQAPEWSQLEPLINTTLASPPQCLILFVLMTDRMTAKYSERGGRFALIEVGAALQNVCLTIAEQKLKGVPLGGLLDEPWRILLGLQNTSARIALGYACGN